MKTPRILPLAALAFALVGLPGPAPAQDDVNAALKKAVEGAKEGKGAPGKPMSGGGLADAEQGKVVEMESDSYDTAKKKKLLLALFSNMGKGQYNSTGKPALDKVAARNKGKVIVGQANGTEQKALMAKVKKAYGGKQCGVAAEGEGPDGFPIFLFIDNEKLAKPRSASEGDTVEACCFNGLAKDKGKNTQFESFQAKLEYYIKACYREAKKD